MLETLRALQNGGVGSTSDLTQRLSAVLPSVAAARMPLRRLAAAWAPPARRMAPAVGAAALAPAVLLVLAGAGCMYMFDPDRGAERRAMAAQWLTSLWEQGREIAERGTERLREVAASAQGVSEAYPRPVEMPGRPGDVRPLA